MLNKSDYKRNIMHLHDSFCVDVSLERGLTDDTIENDIKTES